MGQRCKRLAARSTESAREYAECKSGHERRRICIQYPGTDMDRDRGARALKRSPRFVRHHSVCVAQTRVREPHSRSAAGRDEVDRIHRFFSQKEKKETKEQPAPGGIHLNFPDAPLEQFVCNGGWIGPRENNSVNFRI